MNVCYGLFSAKHARLEMSGAFSRNWGTPNLNFICHACGVLLPISMDCLPVVSYHTDSDSEESGNPLNKCG